MARLLSHSLRVWQMTELCYVTIQTRHPAHFRYRNPMKKLNLCTITVIAMAHSCLVHAGEGAWQTLFDGKSLKGWTTVEGKPPGDGWKVVDGMLHLSGAGGNIVTTEEFGSFEMEWQWKINKKGNNGVKYWVTKVGGKEWLGIEYQMIDDGGHADGTPGSNHATASIYDIKAAAPDKPLRPAGEWNQSRIIAKDGKLQHFLNGILVVELDSKVEEWKTLIGKSKFRNKSGFAPGTGKIMLTDHRDPVWFKEIRIRRL